MRGTAERTSTPGVARRGSPARAVAVAFVLAVVGSVAATPAGAQTNTTVPPDPAAAPVAPTTAPPTTIGTTTTTARPAVCDDVPPTVAQFLGTVTATGSDSVQFRVDEMRSGSPATTLQVLYVRDARFLKDGRRYLVTASLDSETRFLVSKVRTKRGEDPRCTVKDPIYTRNPDGTPVDSGVFAGMKGRSRDVLLAFLKPLGAVLAVLVALVLVKYVLYFGGKGIRRLVSRATT